MTRRQTLISCERDRGLGVRKIALARELNPPEPTTAELQAEHEATWAALQTGEGAGQLAARSGPLFEQAQRAFAALEQRRAREDTERMLRADIPDLDEQRAAWLDAERRKGDVCLLSNGRGELQGEINRLFDFAATQTIAAAAGVLADERLAFELRYAVSWFVGHHPPEGKKRIRWGLVKKHVVRVSDDPPHIHRLWFHLGRSDLTADERHARERAHSLIVHASHPRPDGHRGLWHCPSILTGDWVRKLYAWPPPDGEALTASECDQIRAAAIRVLEEFPRFARMTGGPTDDSMGFGCLVDELAAIFLERTGKKPTASLSDNRDAQVCSPFVRFIAAVFTRLRNLGPEYETYGTTNNLEDPDQDANRAALAKAIGRALSVRRNP